jgi:Icc-related predicted phosphoesterase
MPAMVRVAAAGDVHASEATRERVIEAFAHVESEADVVLLAGDLTTTGEPAQAAVLADAARGLSIPVCAVLGNHDWHERKGAEISAMLEDAGVVMLERSSTVLTIGDVDVGVVGSKGFVGGFPGSALPDFGEPLLRQAYAETTEEVNGIERGLQAVAHCPIRIVLMHYAPTAETLHGEPEGIWTLLGSERLATPIAEYRPDIVLHGHAHAGSFEGSIGSVPVYNVAVHVTGKDFWIFDLEGSRAEVEVEA